jgi:hypothetical protein
MSALTAFHLDGAVIVENVALAIRYELDFTEAVVALRKTLKRCDGVCKDYLAMVAK